VSAPARDQADESGAVFEHTSRSAVTIARYLSATVVPGYSSARQADAERQLAYRHNTADELRTKDGTR